MLRRLSFAVLALLVGLTPVQAADITGLYVEARTCDVWTGPCFANADFNLTGKNAVMAWKIDRGSVNDVSLDGLSVVAVLSAHNTLGLEQTGPTQAVVIVDDRATTSQREALVRLVQQQGGKLLQNIVKVHAAPITMTSCECKGETCAEVNATIARVKTRCLDQDHDKACGNESAYYPPLARNVQARPAGVIEHVFRGSGLGGTWSDYERRGAYVGSFAVR
jgi:hypothetical protein